MKSDEAIRPPGDPRETAHRFQAVWSALKTVTDPEIPVLSVVDMGIIADVRADDAGIVIDITPTFAACPAVALIRDQIREAVRLATGSEATVNVVYDPPWTSDRLTSEGRRKLREFGLAPPGARAAGLADAPDITRVACPFCNSVETDLESIFGPALCRSIHYCRTCRQSFEHFKPV